MNKLIIILGLAMLAGAMLRAGDAPYPPLEDPAHDHATAPDWRVAAAAPKADPAQDPHERGLQMGGPRFGMTYISGDGFQKLQEQVAKAKPGSELEPFMTDFGWQIEYRMFRTSEGLTALTEVIPIIGGLDQGLALPSINWLVGVRGKNGFELGVGPNIGLTGASLVIGTGFTFDMGGINVPLNIAVGQASHTTSVSMSVGFNL